MITVHIGDNTAVLTALSHVQELLMALADSTNQKLNALTAQLADTAAALQEATDGIRGDIVALKNTLPADTTPEFDAALDALMQRADAIKAAADTLKALDAENPAPVVEPPVEPPVDEPVEPPSQS